MEEKEADINKRVWKSYEQIYSRPLAFFMHSFVLACFDMGLQLKKILTQTFTCMLCADIGSKHYVDVYALTDMHRKEVHYICDYSGEQYKLYGTYRKTAPWW